MPRSNTFYKIASVLIAIILWTYVITDVNPTSKQTLANVPVQLINEENLYYRGLAVAADEDYKVDVVVEGKRAEIAKLRPEKILANADLSGFTLGKNYIPVIVTVPDSLKLVEVKTAKIMVNIEELATVSKPVQVSFNGQLKENTEIGDVVNKPKEIDVKGAKSVVNQVAYLKAEIDASKITRDGNKVKAKVIPMNSNGQMVKGVILATKSIEVSAKLYDVKEVPLKMEVTGKVSSLYEVTGTKKPQVIKIRGDKDILNEITEIKAHPIDISKVVGNTSIPIKPILPDGVNIANESKKLTLDVTVKPISSKVFEYNAGEINVQNAPKNLSLSIATDKITVKVLGSDSVLANLTKNDFQPYINLEKAASGATDVDVLVKYEKQVNVEVNPTRIQIVLSEVQQ